MATDLPQYSVRVSKRAKHLRIEVSPKKGIQVIVPLGFEQKKIPAILHKKKNWLEKAIAKIDAQQEYLAAKNPDILPREITLASINETWQVEYQAIKTNRVTIAELTDPEPETDSGITGLLLVSGAIENVPTCKAVLKRWLSQKAWQHLVPWLRDVSVECGMGYAKTAVRGQKSIWASCSSKKTISLNYKLLFLRSPLVRYVFIHELCHTVHMNHSKKFWALVGKQEANYKQLDAQLNDCWRVVPTWVDAED
jgi:predicted metal-dependent hydrolase